MLILFIHFKLFKFLINLRLTIIGKDFIHRKHFYLYIFYKILIKINHMDLKLLLVQSQDFFILENHPKFCLLNLN